MLKLSHKKLNVWKKSILLVKTIYHVTNEFPLEEKFGLTSQIRRASLSTASNIAEGAARKTQKEKMRFYEIARSSLVEIDTQIEIALVLGILTNSQILELSNLVNEIFAMLSGLLKY
jgi:four helix bundle protein